jgi:hypothetical protein
MRTHTFRPAEGALEDRLRVGGVHDGYVFGTPVEADEGVESGDALVIEEDSPEAAHRVSQMMAYVGAGVLEHSVEGEDDVAVAANEAVEQRKAEVAAAGSEDQVDANALGDLSDAGKPSATEARKSLPETESSAGTDDERAESDWEAEGGR